MLFQMKIMETIIENGHIFQIIPIECLIWGSGSGKTNPSLNLIKEKGSGNLIHMIYLHPKDLNEPKYQFLTKKCEDVALKHLNDSNAFREYSTYIADFYKILMITIQRETKNS